VFNPGDKNQLDGKIRVAKESGKWYVMMRIPFKRFWWSEEGLHPVSVGTDNPADLGWLMFR
jgi:hypothetical protein